ncbi:MAG: hydroxypyruvate isomerase family protein [Pararhodobacter sp.]
MRFSANLGFLWRDRPLPDAVRAAARAGFDAVECHWPYATPAADLAAALAETRLPLLGMNTAPGGKGQFGLSALPGHATEARAAIDQALDYAVAVGCGAVHVMAGFAEGPGAEAAFRAALEHACTRAAPLGITILIEPLNTRDAPGYFLTTTEQALALIGALARPNLKLMFDCYHVQIMEGDLTRRLQRLLPHIGHVQIAGVPDRGPPDEGELSYVHLLGVLEAAGWTRPIGAEYRPGDTTENAAENATEASLGWLHRWQQRRG